MDCEYYLYIFDPVGLEKAWELFFQHTFPHDVNATQCYTSRTNAIPDEFLEDSLEHFRILSGLSRVSCVVNIYSLQSLIFFSYSLFFFAKAIFPLVTVLLSLPVSYRPTEAHLTWNIYHDSSSQSRISSTCDSYRIT